MTQAPTPGPLSEPVKGAANGLCNRSACQTPLAGEPTHQFMDGNFTGGPRLHYCEKCAKEFDKWDAIDMKDGEPRRIQREPKSLAPTAPVEASGSERDCSESIIDCEIAREAFDSRPQPSGFIATLTDDQRAETLAYTGDDTHPQPSGETREAVARLVAPTAWAKFDRLPNGGFADHVSRDQGIEWAVYLRPSLDAADRILAFLSARPLALGGQQGEASLRDMRLSHWAEVEPFPARAEAQDEGAIKAAYKRGWNDRESDIIERAERIAPMTRPDQDEGAAGLAFKALDVADRIIQREMGMDVPEEWNAAYRAVADARSRAIAHPSPTPAADDDRVRIAVGALEPFARLELPKKSVGNAGAYSLLHTDIRRAAEALAALKSNAAKEGGEW